MQNQLQIRQNARGMYVTNTTHVQVDRADDIMAVVAQGYRNRTVRLRCSASRQALTMTTEVSNAKRIKTRPGVPRGRFCAMSSG